MAPPAWAPAKVDEPRRYAGRVAPPSRLAEETSPYLRQHAANPVDWHPWGDEAFSEARGRDVPVFLSVGYSACHWCHVMAHESFEDPATASLLNRDFVPVKVDREERPDVDAVYMAAVLAMQGHGGWPMSVFATPDGRPFFAGTYFPPSDRHGLPGFPRLLAAIAEAWRERRHEVEAQADAMAAAVAHQAAAPTPAYGAAGERPPPFRRRLERARADLAGRFDAAWGGFGPAPKFPNPTLVELLLRHHRLTGDGPSLEMAERTLRAMAAGGIHDQLAGGFSRYSTDRSWTVPHFEKMLYDQAGMVRAYLHAWQSTGRPEWLQVVRDTVAYTLADLASPGGGLCSAEDADSEGEEGRFYAWDRAEFDAVLGDEAEAAGRHFGLDAGANFEGRHVLRLDVDGPLLRSAEVERWRGRLRRARGGRVRPGLDDKVLTEWNAMFCSALAEAAAATGDRSWQEAAEQVAGFLVAELRHPNGRWLRSWQGGRARHLAYAGDYAWLVDCFTRMAELTGRRRWLEEALGAARSMLALFRPDGGPLRTTGEDAEALIVRGAEVLDDATPSATAVAGAALVRLGALAADDDLADTGTRLLETLDGLVEEHPLAAAYALAGSELVAEGVAEVVVTGDRPDLRGALRARYEPTAVLAWGEPDGSPLWEGRAEGLAYVCRHRVCAAPAREVEELLARLDDLRAAVAEGP
ncbi:MAG: thioredoxin domain-containing protein [Acidobacteriota bacterium]|nr:thioredoxin domain-containing protein [Acidobacteriota bacterium]